MTRSKLVLVYPFADSAVKIFSEYSIRTAGFTERKTSWKARGISGKSSMTRIRSRGLALWCNTEGMVFIDVLDTV
jgi:hypothetical protein